MFPDASSGVTESATSDVIRHKDTIKFPESLVKFGVTNYFLLSQSMLLNITLGGCLKLLTGVKMKPTVAGSATKLWEMQDSCVKAYIIKIMEQGIAKGYMLMKTAVDIRDVVKGMYSKKGNEAQIYRINRRM